MCTSLTPTIILLGLFSSPKFLHHYLSHPHWRWQWSAQTSATNFGSFSDTIIVIMPISPSHPSTFHAFGIASPYDHPGASSSSGSGSMGLSSARQHLASLSPLFYIFSNLASFYSERRGLEPIDGSASFGTQASSVVSLVTGSDPLHVYFSQPCVVTPQPDSMDLLLPFSTHHDDKSFHCTNTHHIPRIGSPPFSSGKPIVILFPLSVSITAHLSPFVFWRNRS
ncbi:hypothetical protein V8F33_004532 [Rhypophila sp. PSN 637]